MCCCLWSQVTNWGLPHIYWNVDINSAYKMFWKKVWASCNIAKGCLWSGAQLKQIGDSYQAVCESDCEVIKTEWELTLKKDHYSFEMMANGQNWTTALNQRCYTLENPPTWIRGRDPKEEECPCAVIKAVPCMLLPTVQKWHDPCNGWPAEIAFGWCFQAP